MSCTSICDGGAAAAAAAAGAAAECVRGKCCCCCLVRERKLVVLWREVEIRNRKKQGKHKTNGEINEQIAIKKLNEQEKLGERGGGWGWGVGREWW